MLYISPLLVDEVGEETAHVGQRFHPLQTQLNYLIILLLLSDVKVILVHNLLLNLL